MKRLNESLALCKPGTTPYANHCKLIADVERRHRAELRETGVTPSNLGPEQSRKTVFIANVESGPVEAKSKEEFIKLSTANIIKNANRMELAGYWSAEREKFIAELEAEYSDDDVKGPSYEGENEKDEDEDKDK
jgi:hypothetical protein